MATATIVGGHTVNLELDAREATLAQMALTSAGDNYKRGAVLDNLGKTPGAKKFQVWAINGAEGSTIALPSSGFALVAEGSNDVTLVGHTGGEILIGNGGNDTINAAGGNGSIISGGGNDLIELNTPSLSGGNQYIATGNGFDTIQMFGGNATIDNESTAYVSIGGGNNILVGLNDLDITVTGGGNNRLQLTGNDTITFGSGNDTIIEHGTSTITTSAFGVVVESGTGTASMAAGAGSSTLIGGSGNDTFAGGSGSTSMVGGESANTFFGGTGVDTMVGGGTSNLFTFEATLAGGTHEVDGFAHGTDHISLVGYDNFNFGQDVTEVGGNAVITLDNGHTVITVEHTTLTQNDFT